MKLILHLKLASIILSAATASVSVSMEASQETHNSLLFTRKIEALSEAESCNYDIRKATILNSDLRENENLSDTQKKFLNFLENNREHMTESKDLHYSVGRYFAVIAAARGNNEFTEDQKNYSIGLSSSLAPSNWIDYAINPEKPMTYNSPFLLEGLDFSHNYEKKSSFISLTTEEHLPFLFFPVDGVSTMGFGTLTRATIQDIFLVALPKKNSVVHGFQMTPAMMYAHDLIHGLLDPKRRAFLTFLSKQLEDQQQTNKFKFETEFRESTLNKYKKFYKNFQQTLLNFEKHLMDNKKFDSAKGLFLWIHEFPAISSETFEHAYKNDPDNTVMSLQERFEDILNQDFGFNEEAQSYEKNQNFFDQHNHIPGVKFINDKNFAIVILRKDINDKNPTVIRRPTLEFQLRNSEDYRKSLDMPKQDLSQIPLDNIPTIRKSIKDTITNVVKKNLDDLKEFLTINPILSE